jgi:hypothetical protein
MADATRRETVTECCGVRLRGAECPICQGELRAALDQLAAVDDHPLSGRCSWWFAVAEAGVEFLAENGHAAIGARIFEHVLVEADDRLAKVERRTDDDLVTEHVREARQILVGVAEHGGASA